MKARIDALMNPLGFKNSIIKLVSTILHIGTIGIDDQDEIKRIKLTNSIGTLIALMILIIAPIGFIITKSKLIAVAASIDFLVTLSVLPLNYYKKHLAARFVIYFSQCSALIGFGIVLGGLLQLQCMVVFLISILYQLFKEKILRIICLVTAIVTLVVMQTIYYLNSVQIQPLELGTAYVIQSMALAGVLLLILVISKPYVHSNDYYSELKRANQFIKIFTYRISHELRNTLNKVILSSHLIKNETLKNEDMKSIVDLIDIIESSSREAKNIVNNVLSMSQIESGQMDPVILSHFHVTKFLEKVLDIYRLLARGKGIQVQLIIEDKMPSVIIGDPLKISEIINNLVGNAIKYSHKYSTIYLKVTVNEDTYQIDVTNKGEVIPEEKITQIFDPFITSKVNRQTEGTGLGLALVKSIAEAMNGCVSVTTPIPDHTTFSVKLPLLIGDESKIEEENEDDEMAIFQFPHSIVIADDDDMNNTLLCRVLEDLGCKVRTASNGQEALEAIWRKVPDLIILDSNMPILNGGETLKKLKSDSKTKNIPVLIATADAFAENQVSFISAGASAVLSKPIVVKDVAKVLTQHLQQHCDDQLKK
ncbi:ATP-binding response regulator [Chitinophaga varians]|uniref:ATP-binding response regulator n=1 Tax=Chitinophaga varians TaxID=2202339 RepID=UPI00165F7497|nr:hybrid sensor histidine kinase/response regulator [Chitinophaga varians]MBC9909099.1 response regulator [Chitinophaga varians]